MEEQGKATTTKCAYRSHPQVLVQRLLRLAPDPRPTLFSQHRQLGPLYAVFDVVLYVFVVYRFY